MFGRKQKQSQPPPTDEPVRLNDYVVDAGHQPQELENLNDQNVVGAMSFLTPQYGCESSSQKSAASSSVVTKAPSIKQEETHSHAQHGPSHYSDGVDQPSAVDDAGERAMLPLEETDTLVASKPNPTATTGATATIPKPKKKTKRPQKREEDGADLPSKHDYQSNILQKHSPQQDGIYSDLGPKIDPTIADDHRLRNKLDSMERFMQISKSTFVESRGDLPLRPFEEQDLFHPSSIAGIGANSIQMMNPVELGREILDEPSVKDFYDGDSLTSADYSYQDELDNSLHAADTGAGGGTASGRRGSHGLGVSGTYIATTEIHEDKATFEGHILKKDEIPDDDYGSMFHSLTEFEERTNRRAMLDEIFNTSDGYYDNEEFEKPQMPEITPIDFSSFGVPSLLESDSPRIFHDEDAQQQQSKTQEDQKIEVVPVLGSEAFPDDYEEEEPDTIAQVSPRPGPAVETKVFANVSSAPSETELVPISHKHASAPLASVQAEENLDHAEEAKMLLAKVEPDHEPEKQQEQTAEDNEEYEEDEYEEEGYEAEEEQVARGEEEEQTENQVDEGNGSAAVKSETAMESPVIVEEPTTVEATHPESSPVVESGVQAEPDPEPESEHVSEANLELPPPQQQVESEELPATTQLDEDKQEFEVDFSSVNLKERVSMEETQPEPQPEPEPVVEQPAPEPEPKNEEKVPTPVKISTPPSPEPVKVEPVVVQSSPQPPPVEAKEQTPEKVAPVEVVVKTSPLPSISVPIISPALSTSAAVTTRTDRSSPPMSPSNSKTLSKQSVSFNESSLATMSVDRPKTSELLKASSSFKNPVAKLRGIVLGAKSIDSHDANQSKEAIEMQKRELQLAAERLMKIRDEELKIKQEEERKARELQEEEERRLQELQQRRGKAKSVGFNSIKAGLSKREYQELLEKSPVKPSVPIPLSRPVTAANTVVAGGLGEQSSLLSAFSNPSSPVGFDSTIEGDVDQKPAHLFIPLSMMGGSGALTPKGAMKVSTPIKSTKRMSILKTPSSPSRAGSMDIGDTHQGSMLSLFANTSILDPLSVSDQNQNTAVIPKITPNDALQQLLMHSSQFGPSSKSHHHGHGHGHHHHGHHHHGHHHGHHHHHNHHSNTSSSHSNATLSSDSLSSSRKNSLDRLGHGEGTTSTTTTSTTSTKTQELLDDEVIFMALQSDDLINQHFGWNRAALVANVNNANNGTATAGSSGGLTTGSKPLSANNPATNTKPTTANSNTSSSYMSPSDKRSTNRSSPLRASLQQNTLRSLLTKSKSSSKNNLPVVTSIDYIPGFDDDPIDSLACPTEDSQDSQSTNASSMFSPRHGLSGSPFSLLKSYSNSDIHLNSQQAPQPHRQNSSPLQDNHNNNKKIKPTSIFYNYSGMLYKDPSLGSTWREMNMGPPPKGDVLQRAIEEHQQAQDPTATFSSTKRNLSAGRMMNSYRPWGPPRPPNKHDEVLEHFSAANSAANSVVNSGANTGANTGNDDDFYDDMSQTSQSMNSTGGMGMSSNMGLSNNQIPSRTQSAASEGDSIRQNEQNQNADPPVTTRPQRRTLIVSSSSSDLNGRLHGSMISSNQGRPSTAGEISGVQAGGSLTSSDGSFHTTLDYDRPLTSSNGGSNNDNNKNEQGSSSSLLRGSQNSLHNGSAFNAMNKEQRNKNNQAIAAKKRLSLVINIINPNASNNNNGSVVDHFPPPSAGNSTYSSQGMRSNTATNSSNPPRYDHISQQLFSSTM